MVRVNNEPMFARDQPLRQPLQFRVRQVTCGTRNVGTTSTPASSSAERSDDDDCPRVQLGLAECVDLVLVSSDEAETSLSQEAYGRFLEALDAPPERNPALVDLAKRARRIRRVS